MGFTLIVTVGFVSAVLGAHRAHQYMQLHTADPVERGLARSRVIRQVLFAVALGFFVIVGGVSVGGISGPLEAAVVVIALFTGPTVLTAASLIDNFDLWRIEHMK